MKLQLNITDDELHALVRQVVSALEVARSDASLEIRKLNDEANVQAANAILQHLHQLHRIGVDDVRGGVASSRLERPAIEAGVPG